MSALPPVTPYSYHYTPGVAIPPRTPMPTVYPPPVSRPPQANPIVRLFTNNSTELNDLVKQPFLAKAYIGVVLFLILGTLLVVGLTIGLWFDHSFDKVDDAKERMATMILGVCSVMILIIMLMFLQRTKLDGWGIATVFIAFSSYLMLFLMRIADVVNWRPFKCSNFGSSMASCVAIDECYWDKSTTPPNCREECVDFNMVQCSLAPTRCVWNTERNVCDKK